MAEAGEKTIECGFCLRKNEALEEPKVLPCTHVHCLPCLMGFYEVNHMLQCPLPTCRQVVEKTINSLPSANTSDHNSTHCDSCMKRGDNTKAVVYCTQCNRKYCTTHLEFHDGLYDDHERVNMEEYKVKVNKLKVKECVNHKGQQYVLGCKVCLAIVCHRCLAGLDSCVNGKSHGLLPLDELVTALVDEDIKAKMVDREEKLEKLFKMTSKVSSEYDVKTSKMVEMLDEKRNEQLKAISEKYDRLKKELVEKRKKKRLELAEFLENRVLQRWIELRNQRLRIESKLEHCHEVDIIKGYQEMKDEAKGLIEDVLPKLNLTDLVELEPTDESRSIELEIASGGFDIDSEQGVQSHSLSLTLHQTVQLPARPLSLCQRNEDIYVGLNNNTIARIDSNFQVRKDFVKCDGEVESVTIHKERAYTLLWLNRDKVVKMYDLSGTQVFQWTHAALKSYYTNTLSIVSDEIAIADRAKNRVTVYSLTGTLLRHITCPSFGDTNIVQCTVDNMSIVVSDRGTRRVFRLNIASGEVMWTHKMDSEPEGVTRYGTGYVLVASYNSSTVRKLDVNTGKEVSQLKDDKIGGDNVLGLTTVNRMLVAAKLDAKCVLFYK